MASISISDEGEYRKYLDGADKVFARFGGEYLAVDKCPLVLEGSWDYDRAVLIRFSSREDFERWYNSEAYREILKFRLNAARCDTILVKGKEVPVKGNED